MDKAGDILEDVGLVSSTDIDDGDSGDKAADADKSEDRPDKNYMAEILRKQDKATADNAKMIRDGFEQIAKAIAPNTDAPKPKTGNTLDDTPLEQVRALLPTVDDELRPQLESYISKRETQESVDTRLSAWETRQDEQAAKEKASVEAAVMYPDLADETSDFSVQVQRYLDSLGDSYRLGNPRSLLDAANAVAIREGKAAASQTSRGPATTPANRKNSAPAPKGEGDDAGEGPFTMEYIEQIAENLKHAKKGGFSDLKQKRKDANLIFNNKEYFIS